MSVAALGPEQDQPLADQRVRPAPGEPWASALYVGAVRHRRYEVREHTLRYRLALAYLDLDELPDLLGGRLVDPRPGLVRFRRRDYLGRDERRPLSTAVRDEVEKQTGRRPAGPIRLLTQLRSWGLCFNPVSFYYCFDASGGRLESVLAEVTNTPWGERHAYVINTPAPRAAGTLTGESEKMLHVSPFMSMDHSYEWHVTAPGRTLHVHIENHRGGRRAFDATLAMRRRPLNESTLVRTALDPPFATLRVLALIYSHALRLKLKGVPIHPHPAPEVS